MRAVDIGLNLMDRRYNKNRDAVVSEAYANGIGIIITGCSSYSNLNAVQYIKKNPKFGMKCTIGLHPHNASSYTEDFLEQYVSLMCDNRDMIVAVGEIGLDYDRMYSEKGIQFHVFQEMLGLARKFKLPVFLHERGAYEDFTFMLRDNPDVAENSVVHCFTGSWKHAETYLELGCMIGITGWVCDDRRNADLVEAVKRIPLDRIMVETDGPYLMPRDLKLKGRDNMPVYLPYVWEKIAEIKGMSADDVRQAAFDNTCRFFKLPYRFDKE